MIIDASQDALGSALAEKKINSLKRRRGNEVIVRIVSWILLETN
jgi:hypothetical protein